MALQGSDVEERLNDVEERLNDVALQGNVDALYALIKEDVNLLERIDKLPFAHTPLHIAASVGNTCFAMEMIKLKASFARKLNHDGFSPMHLALENGHTKMVRRLVEVDPTLVRVKGRLGMTPFHHVVEAGDCELLVYIIEACPRSILDVTSQNETALHIAAKNNGILAFKKLLAQLRMWRTLVQLNLKEKATVLDWEDDEGHTVLHAAVSRNQLEIATMLMKRPLVDINSAKNLGSFEGTQSRTSTYLEVTSMLQQAKQKLILSPVRIFLNIFFLKQNATNNLGNISNDLRSILLVAVALVVTTTYSAGLNPPGGVWQDASAGNTTLATCLKKNDSSVPTALIKQLSSPHLAGQAIMDKWSFISFSVLNTSCFLFSTILMMLLLPYQTSPGMLPLTLSVLSFVGCYFSALGNYLLPILGKTTGSEFIANSTCSSSPART